MDVNTWSLNKRAVVTSFGSSDSAGYKKAVAGTKSASGQVRVKWDDALVLPCREGDSGTLNLFLNGSGVGNEKFTVPCVIETCDVECDMDDGTVTSAVLGFVSNGAWTEPTLA